MFSDNEDFMNDSVYQIIKNIFIIILVFINRVKEELLIEDENNLTKRSERGNK